MTELEQTTFPSADLISAVIPEGRGPYLELALALGKISDPSKPYPQVKIITETLQSLALADSEDALKPPLTPGLSNVVQRAADNEIVKRRPAEDHDPRWNVDGSGYVLVEDHTSAAYKLLQVIAVHGGVSELRPLPKK